MTTPPDQLRDGAAAVQRGDFAGALVTLQAGLQTAPNDPALLGLTALAALRLDQQPLAADLLRRQLSVTPDDRAARYNLATTLAGLGQIDEASELAAKFGGHAKLARLAGYLAQQSGRANAAISAYREAVRIVPSDWESWNNLANSCVAVDDISAAIPAFENAINEATVPVPEVFINLIQALATVGNRELRLYSAEQAAQRFPDHAGVRIEYALALVGMGRSAEAVVVLREVAAQETGFGEAQLELGLVYEHQNRLDELDALIAARADETENPGLDFLRAWSLRRRDKFAEAYALAQKIPPTLNPVRAAQLRAELADRLGDPAEAFVQFTAMNQAAAAAVRPTGPVSYRARIEAQTAALTPPPGPALALPGIDPIFVVGFPRSGTTLLDTLLSGLPELQVFEEMPLLAEVDAAFPGLAHSTDPALIARARHRYFELAEAAQGAAGARRIVDKHPLLMTQLPLIHRMFPAAQMVLVERHPCDAVLSCFMANFQLNSAMRSFIDLDEAARTYDAVFTNFTRASALYPVALHRIRYERMVTDLEGEMRPLLEFLGLQWTSAVLDNQTSAAKRGAVRTASYAQIGQPLYTRAAGRWERYRAQMVPVLPLLQPWIDELGYAATIA